MFRGFTALEYECVCTIAFKKASLPCVRIELRSIRFGGQQAAAVPGLDVGLVAAIQHDVRESF